jgi:hypothetical protein
MSKEETQKTHSFSLPFEWVLKALFTPSLEHLGKKLPDWVHSLTHKKELVEGKYLELKKLIEDKKGGGGYKKNFSEGKSYLSDGQIIKTFHSYGYFLKRGIKKCFIEKFEINSYDQRDIFFAATELFFKYLTKDDIEKIYQKHKDSNQAIIWPFLEDVEARKPRLLSKEQKEYLHKRKDFHAAEDMFADILK